MTVPPDELFSSIMKIQYQFILACILGSSVFCDRGYDYYWRDYINEVPDDAVIGGRDAKHNPTYIGQVYKNSAIIPARIYPGKRSIPANFGDLDETDVYVKILCSNSRDRLKWVKSTATSLQYLTDHIVEGGVENAGTTNIGRIFHQSEVIVGKVCGYLPGSALLYFTYLGEEVSADSYEVLIYDNSSWTGKP